MTLGLLLRPVLLPTSSPLDINWFARVAGSVKGGARVRLLGFPVFVRLVTHHLSEGAAPLPGLVMITMSGVEYISHTSTHE